MVSWGLLDQNHGMDLQLRSIVAICFVGFAAPLLLNGSTSLSEEKKRGPCTEDAIIVFDTSGSMSGNQTLGIPNSRARIDEARAALAEVLPSATKARKVHQAHVVVKRLELARTNDATWRRPRSQPGTAAASRRTLGGSGASADGE
jgi:hypothetical protein